MMELTDSAVPLAALPQECRAEGGGRSQGALPPRRSGTSEAKRGQTVIRTGCSPPSNQTRKRQNHLLGKIVQRPPCPGCHGRFFLRPCPPAS